MSSNGGGERAVVVLTDSQRWFWLIFAAITGWLFYLLSPVLTPFIISALFAYLGDPLVDRLEAHKIRRSFAVTMVFILMVIVILLLAMILVPLIEEQISELFRKIPLYLDWLRENVLPKLEERFGGIFSLSSLSELQGLLAKHWKEAGGLIAAVVGKVSSSGMALIGWLANIVLIPVLTFYLLRDWDDLIAGIKALLPRKREPTITALAVESDEMLGGFLRGQMMVMTGLGVIYTTGLWFVGLDFALLIGMLAGFVSFVPYLGLILGILVASIAAVLQFKGIEMLPWVWLVFIVGQMVEGMFLTPKFVGDRIGLHPVAVIFAVMAGAQLWGFVGIIAALPVASVVMVLVRHAVDQYRGSVLYHGEEVELAEEGSASDNH